MGACCGKDSMPVVDDFQKRRQEEDTTGSPVAFDYVFDGRNDPTDRRGARSNSPQPQPEMAYTPRELDATTVGALSATATARSLGALSFITNGNQDVSYDYIGQFVERIRDGQMDPLEGSVMGGSFAGTIASRGSGGDGGSLTRDQAAYLNQAPDIASKLARLREVEESRRVDIIAAHRMNAMLFHLAAQKMVPTVRRRKSIVAPSSHEKSGHLRKGKPSKKKSEEPSGVPPVVVIHAQDIQIEFNEQQQQPLDETCNLDQTVHSLAGTCDGFAQSAVFNSTRQGVEQETSKAMFSPVGGTPPASVPFGTNASMAFAATAAQQQQQQQYQQPVVEHFEMLTLSAREVSITGNVKGLVVGESWDFLSLPHTSSQLSNGDAMYRFVSKPAHELDPSSLEMLSMFINVSSFANEQSENNAPFVDCASRSDLSKYVTILAKAMYVLPGVRLGTISKELLASLDYQKNCQAGETKFFEDVVAPFTFRQTKTIIKFLFSLLIQMKVSEITDPQILSSFKEFDGIIPAKAILLERTKKNVSKVDSTAKCKSVLLYYPINDGVLVSHATIVLNTSLPGIISKVLHTFGGQGAKENADAVRNTRRYLIHKFGDSREGFSGM